MKYLAMKHLTHLTHDTTNPPGSPVPARVFGLIPENNHLALLLRRGPSKHVGVFQWNMHTDEIRLSQWLKGRIYEQFCDISPDGQYFVFSFNKKGYCYTAVSNAPWIKALSLWTESGGWGGGFFLDSHRFTLQDHYVGSQPRFTAKEPVYELINLDRSVYHHRLVRAGWAQNTASDDLPDSAERYYKDLNARIRIEKIVVRQASLTHQKAQGKPTYWEYHQLFFGSDRLELPHWEWCEVINQSIVWSERGQLFRASLAQGALSEPQCIHDFNPYSFVERCAPY